MLHCENPCSNPGDFLLEVLDFYKEFVLLPYQLNAEIAQLVEH